MTTQAAMIMDTILGMKRTIAQQDESSDSDDRYLLPTNRGNKLKRKARHHADAPSKSKRGRPAYRKTIDYAGYKRDILRRNPKRYDHDGDELDSEDDDEAADARAAEQNPYADVKLDKLLCPLTSAALLPEHPSLSVPYLSSTLSDMAQQACEAVQRERKTLENAKLLLVKLRGDETWIPTEQVNAADDEEIFDTKHVYDQIISKSSLHGVEVVSKNETTNGESSLDSSIQTMSDNDVGIQLNGVKGRTPMGTRNGIIPSIDSVPAPEKADTVSEDTSRHHNLNGKESPINDESPSNTKLDGPPGANGDHRGSRQGSTSVGTSRASKEKTSIEPTKQPSLTQAPALSDTDMTQFEKTNLGSGDQPEVREDEMDLGPGDTKVANGHEEVDEKMEGDGNEDQPAPRRMRTRAQAQAVSEPTASPRNLSAEPPYVAPQVHPLFLLPDTAKPDADYGLSAAEAEETRRMLMIYIQKQEEVCRGAEQLYEGLLKANRQRKTVLRWCKAEGHVGEMSDGEDWYDKEEWGLEDDLRKGEADERVADDDAGVQGKKTRGRRA